MALARFAALSRGDIERLTWSEVDLQLGEIRIERAKTRVPQHVPIDPTLRRLLEEWRGKRHSFRVDGTDLVVPAGSVKYDNIGRSFAGYCRQAGVPRYGKPLHALRDACINDWFRMDPAPPIASVQLWAGHSSITTTLKFYHAAQDSDMDQAKQTPLLGQAPDYLPNQFPKAGGVGA